MSGNRETISANGKRKVGRKPTPEVPCLNPACTRTCGGSSRPNLGGSRGLCAPCYNDALRLVKQGKTTWEEMERLGLAKPPRGTMLERAIREARRKATESQPPTSTVAQEKELG